MGLIMLANKPRIIGEPYTTSGKQFFGICANFDRNLLYWYPNLNLVKKNHTKITFLNRKLLFSIKNWYIGQSCRATNFQQKSLYWEYLDGSSASCRQNCKKVGFSYIFSIFLKFHLRVSTTTFNLWSKALKKANILGLFWLYKIAMWILKKSVS